MHILFLSDNFPPEVNAPASRTFEHCREWVKAGHQVTVISCVPNFPKGRVYAGYRNRLWQTEIIEGIRLLRVWSYITANEGFVKRILDYQSFMVAATLAGLLVRRVDVVVGTSPQFFTVCAAWVLSVFKRIPFVFELRDLWPESIKAVGAMQDSTAIRWLEKLELFLYRKAKLIVTVTHAFRDKLIRRGIDGNKISVVTNGVDMGRFKSMPKDPSLVRQLGLEGKFVGGYVGTHGLAHHLETVLDAAEKFIAEGLGEDFHFILLGDGARKPALQDEAHRRRLQNVTFVDTVPKDEVARYWSLLDVSIIHLRKTELFTTVIPSKLFECMGMGLPVLHGVAGESADMVCAENVGIVFEPENAEELVTQMKVLKNDRSRYEIYRANSLVAARKYDRTALAMEMLALLDKLVAGRA
ncbi:MAG: glycosyltransferase family 4 protein [Candidatus Accumulibacter phosphatis]|uniref:GDP-mannose-dependent alpha-mannosyltransferase n=2 Tax=Candidatus Accumulibacter TaxID=327159 RepID=A0A080M8Z8_9PROT|nr:MULTISPECIES: glycosyltransferase family 4 protein [Candidatus Accumulibacter]KFB77723.1 MAG: GDP-mannose-dependent alpha-mannosyltransferase [Candidatus Accumulibacter cognatus]MBN8517407.1 glycosyltransferase family 4 protein [Accumulibacter sp.]MBO3710659.1 glycosyltransferase family 4 protein [Accumulibacter sp.]MCC2869841.1 glycosyltransferase family 4 protein [Candidatus Accumulibacter phosphatis]MCM8579559.1 glycosyltransferase family 4 protein [Accumulibacter sp.]